MSSRLFLGPLLLLVWQVAPVTAVPDSSGRYRITLGYGGGQLEYRRLDCSGNVVAADPSAFSFGAVELEAWPDDRLRVTGAAALIRTSPGEASAFDVHVTTMLAGTLLAYEGGVAGIGLGISNMGRWFEAAGGEVDNTPALPAFYLRLGSRAGAHYRLDVLTPTAFVPVSGVVRTGLGWGRGRERRASGFAGVSFGPAADEAYPVGGFLELGIPITGRVDAMAAGVFRPSHTFTDWGLVVGGRINLGR
jgi:hypothetical protein